MITKAAAEKVLRKRVIAAQAVKPIELDPNFAAQNDFINDPSRYLVAQCSRRAGKTNALAIRFFKTMERHPKSTCIYLSLTFDSAREILWPVLHELNDKHNLGCKFVESKLNMIHPNGSRLRILGADMSNFIKRLKGVKSPGIAIDEAQDFGPHLQSLINDVLTPCLSDYSDGWLALTGTPGPVPQGYFFQSTQERRFGYSYHAWTILNNPYMPNPEGFIDEQMKRNEWQSNNPTLLREWRNQWVLDVNSLWVQYNADKNNFVSLPEIKPHKWHYIMGVDIGFRDADAIAILAWSEGSPSTFLVEEFVARKQTPTELAEKIAEFQKKYDIDKIVMDEGGLGKKIAEDFRQRLQLPIHPADKAHKQSNVAFLNDNMRLSKFFAKHDSQFAKDSYLVQIDWDKSRPDKIVIKKHPHSDIIDAVLYAFRESPAYSYEPPKPKPKANTDSWYQLEREKMFQEAVDQVNRDKHIKEQQQDEAEWWKNYSDM